MEKKTQINTWYLVLAVLGVTLLQSVWVQWREVEVVPYSQFEKLLKDGKIAEIVVTEEHIHGVLKQPLKDGRTQVAARRVEPDLARELSAYDVTVTGSSEKTFFGQLLSWVMPAVVFFAVWLLVVRRSEPRLQRRRPGKAGQRGGPARHPPRCRGGCRGRLHRGLRARQRDPRRAPRGAGDRRPQAAGAGDVERGGSGRAVCARYGWPGRRMKAPAVATAFPATRSARLTDGSARGAWSTPQGGTSRWRTDVGTG